MLQEFFQMGLPAALAICAILGAPVAFYSVVAYNARARVSDEQDYSLKLADRAHKAKQIETK